MSPVCSWDDVGYIIYETAGLITSASEYGRDVYANVLYTPPIKYNVM